MPVASSANDAVSVSYSAEEVRALKHGNDVLKDARERATAFARSAGRTLVGQDYEASRDPETGSIDVVFDMSPES